MAWPGTEGANLPSTLLPCWIEATVRPRHFNGELIVDVQRMQVVMVDEINLGAAVLPQRLCPAQAQSALRDLVEFQQSIECPELQRFVTNVLCDTEIEIGFLTAPASRNHHHAFAGGLLVHSVSPLALVKTMAEELFLDDQEAIEVTQVGYLFHDLGKVQASCQAPHTRHEFLAGLLIGPHLNQLAHYWARGASALRYIFDYIDQPRATRRRAEFAGADVVVWVDQHSASLAAGRGLDAGSSVVAIESAKKLEVRHVAR